MKHHFHRIKTWYRHNSNPPWRDNEKWIEEQAKASLITIMKEIDKEHPKLSSLVRGNLIRHKVSEWF